MKIRAQSLLVVLLAFCSFTAFAQKEGVRMQNRRALVQMERDFAKAAATKGTRDAFLEFLADDGILFQPGPVNGKKYWTDRPARKGLLSWQPLFADVSRGGDLGYTTGPWEFRPNAPDDNPVAFGQYFTIWKKQSDGSWKAALDRGVASDKPIPARIVQFPIDDERITAVQVDLVRGRQQLLALESELNAIVGKKGIVTGFEQSLAEDARILRPNVNPVIGKKAALVLWSSYAGTLSWQPAQTDISVSGDLGYAYGTFELKKSATVVERGSYVRVWKKITGAWRIVVDVSSPDPQ
jgi:ketosteroid isomerase-like protein